MSFLFIRVFLGGLWIIGSLSGWGWLLNSTLQPHRKDNVPSIGHNAALGLAWSTIFGGYLNLVHQIARVAIGVYLLAGLLLAIVALTRRYTALRDHAIRICSYFGHNKIATTVTLLLCMLALLKYTAAVSPARFNPDDDYRAYLTFPLKMIETGSLGDEPFSYRRLVSSLGGQAFLDTFSLTLGDLRNLHLMDEGVAYLLLVLLFLEMAIAKALEARWIVLLILVVELFPFPVINISAVYSAVLLFLLLLALFERAVSAPPSLAQSTVLAVTIASLVSLKYSFAPAAGLFLLSSFVLQLIWSSFRRAVLVNAGFCALLTTVFLIPWMVASYQSSGTLFFGLLGSGFHGSRYGTAVLPMQTLGIQNVLAFFHSSQDLLPALFIVLVIALFKADQKAQRRRIVDLVILGNILLGATVIAISMGGYQVARYTFPLLFAAVMYCLLKQLTVYRQGELDWSPSGNWTTSMLLLGSLVGGALTGFFGREEELLASIKSSIRAESIVTSSELTHCALMQATVPPGEKLLVRLDKNFLPDFRRNRVYIVDDPGEVSPPPGMPVFRGPESLATYLVGHGIRYLAYSYGDEAGFSRRDLGTRLDPKGRTNAWIREGTQLAFDFQDNLASLGKSRKKLYDDGAMFAIDLATKAD